MFKTFKEQVQKRFKERFSNQDTLFTTNADKDLLWETYLNSFPDPVERQSYNCNCCRQFIKNYGNIVVIVGGEMVTLWDFTPEEDVYIPTVKALHELVKGSTIKDLFISDTKKLGVNSNTQTTETGTIVWNHFALELPAKFVSRNSESIASLKGTARDNKNVFKRSLDEITVDALETVLELISQNSLYRGQEFKAPIQLFLNNKKSYDQAENKDNWAWVNAATAPHSVSKIRNSAIGTLLTDVSEGRELDQAVAAFERMVAPTNYKRPNAVVTKRMIEQAEKTIEELGLANSLHRRFATEDDISVNDILFVNRDTKKALGIFDELKEDVVVNPRSLSKVEEINIDTFLSEVLPNSKSLEVLFENGHLNNLVSIITEKEEASPLLFKWGNPFSWSYTNAVTDSIKERVKEAGGKVDGVLRFSIQWNEDGRSICDFDAHAYEPNGTHINFRSYKGRPTPMTGMLDVDMIRPSGIGVENITWTDLSKMREGVYKFKIHNYDGGSNTGFTAQIECDGQIFDFSCNKRVGGTTDVAEVTYTRADGFVLKSLLDSTTSVTSKSKWNLDTNKFQKVSMVMNSPNYWGGEVGNKHTFFMLENAKTDETPRGFFNEFLTEELLKNKRVFEVLGGKLKVEPSEKQLSGLGFSSTQRNHVICRVEGKFKRLLKIKF